MSSAILIDMLLDHAPKSSHRSSLHDVKITGSDKTAFDALAVIVAHAGMKSVLSALKEIQDGK